MKSGLHSLFLVLFIFILPETSILAKRALPLKIMPLGDSITEGGYSVNGIYYSQGGGYRLYLEKQLLPLNPQIQFVGSLAHGPTDMPQRNHEGHSGWKVEQIAQSVSPWLQTYKPDVILLMIGTNNMWYAADRLHAVEYYENLIDQIYKDLPKVKVFAATIVNTNNGATNNFIAQFNYGIVQVLLRKIGQKKNVTIVDMNRESTVDESDLTDGVHPNPAGYKKIADVWLHYLITARR